MTFLMQSTIVVIAKSLLINSIIFLKVICFRGHVSVHAFWHDYKKRHVQRILEPCLAY